MYFLRFWKIVLLMFAVAGRKLAMTFFFSLQATLQTSPAGHTTSFQMFNSTYKLYSYRLVFPTGKVGAFFEASEI